MAAWICILAALPLYSQNNKGSRTNTATAVMQVRVNVVPMVLLPVSKQDAFVSSRAVTYNVPTHAARLVVREELRPLNAADGMPQAAGTLLRVITVVAE